MSEPHFSTELPGIFEPEFVPAVDDRQSIMTDSPRGFRKRWAQKRKLPDPDISFVENEVTIPVPEPQDLPSLGPDYEKTINAAFQRCRPDSLKLPWEQGPFSFIFGNRKSLPLDCSKQPVVSSFVPIRVLPLSSSSSSFDRSQTRGTMDDRAPQPVTSWCIRVTCTHEDAAKAALEQRARAVGKWYKLVEEYPYASSTGMQLLVMKSQGAQVSACKDSLDDVFGMKAAGTLNKRVASLWRYVTWCRTTGHQPFPMSEPVAYEYVRYLDVCAGASAAASFREAINFAIHIVGFSIDESITASKRIHGSCQKQLAKKGFIAQASPLTVDQVKKLEAFACDAAEHYDRFAAGCLILALLGRCRWSDFSWVERLDLSDPCFVEFGTSVHKTAGLMGKRNMLLPIIIPTRSMSEHRWFDYWLDAAEILGLGLERIPLGPVLPALDIKGKAVQVAVSSKEVTHLLNLILEPNPGQKISSHSLKATCLSWAAKAGLTLEHREILGRHSRSSSTTSALYSRDLQGGALDAFDDMLTKITRGIFVPDAVRSARWPKAGSGPLIDLTIHESEPEPVKHEPDTAPEAELDVDFDSEQESEASSLGIVELEPRGGAGPENECYVLSARFLST